ncbi:MAG: hypothetical protein RR086_01075 [Clostridia bacterium]
MNFKALLLDKSIKSLQRAFIEKRAGQTYIIEAEQSIVTQLLRTVAMFAVCKDGGCYQCNACLKAQKAIHNDILSFPSDKDKNKMTVDDVSTIIGECIKSPVEAQCRVITIDATSSTGAQADLWQNKLLKTLEEPPQNVYIFIAVKGAIELLPTVRSRCQQLTVKEVSQDKVKSYLVESGYKLEYAEVCSALSRGSINKAETLIKTEKLFSAFADALNMLTSMTSTRNSLTYVSKLSAYKDSYIYVLSSIELLLRESIMQFVSPKEVELTSYRGDLMAISNNYSVEAMRKCIELVENAKTSLEFGGNYLVVIDNLILRILEEKYICRI